MLTQKRLKELLHYDPETGCFTWIKKPHPKANAIYKGKKAGTVRAGGYLGIRIDGICRSVHRLAWLYMQGESPDCDIDHIDGVKTNNKWNNLRLATRSQNMQNMKKAHRDSETGYLGIEKKRDKYMARICTNGERKNLGTYDTPEEAHEVYLKAKRKYHKGCTI